MILVNSGLPLFHILTGCSTNSYIQTCDNKSGSAALKNTPGLIETLLTITEDPQCLTMLDMPRTPYRASERKRSQ